MDRSSEKERISHRKSSSSAREDRESRDHKHRHHRRRRSMREKSTIERESRREREDRERESYKRKEREESEDKKERRERRRFEDKEDDIGNESTRQSDSSAVLESLSVQSRSTTDTNNLFATKVNSICSTNENKGVNINITVYDEVNGKSCTDDGSSTTAGKSGALSLDALAKAKQALQKKQKEVREKLKKMKLDNSVASSKVGQLPLDEHGNVINISTTPSSNLSTLTLKVNINKKKKDEFQIEKPELEVYPEKNNPYFDPRMGINVAKLLRPKRMCFQFVDKVIKLKSQFGEAQAKELQQVAERGVTKEKQKEPIPDFEPWDVPLLHTGNYSDVLVIDDKLIKMEKITIYVEHPRPIEPPVEAPPPSPQPLKLTKKEQKKLRTQWRLAREKGKQEAIRKGLIEQPKPKVKMSNVMRVLGSEATQYPTRMDKDIRGAAAEREQAHVDRNIARKLTPAERRMKKERKLFDDPDNTLETMVSVYKINSRLRHPQNRFKVDINAQENRLTGCAVVLLHEDFSVVVVEGGSKSIRRYENLMLRRIDWDAKLETEDGEEDEKPSNRCVLVWQGSVARQSFNRFYVHDCLNLADARKVFVSAGVAHYWDLAANFVVDL